MGNKFVIFCAVLILILLLTMPIIINYLFDPALDIFSMRKRQIMGFLFQSLRFIVLLVISFIHLSLIFQCLLGSLSIFIFLEVKRIKIFI